VPAAALDWSVEKTVTLLADRNRAALAGIKVTKTHVRVGAGWFSISFPIVLGVLLWGGLICRDDRLRNVIPLVRPGSDGRVDSPPSA